MFNKVESEGQKVYVAEWGESFINHYNRQDRRLIVIYDNATQSDLLLRSLQPKKMS